jgi:poly(3-hydroxybutyrate) depolymerase
VTWRSCRRSAAALACVLAFSLEAAEPLPALDADAREITASGLSSGGYMAVQLHVAHSSRVRGVAAIAAGPYGCAQGSLWTAYYNCMSPGAWTPLPPQPLLRQQALGAEKAGRIDATANLAAAKVWLFSGTNDRTVLPEVVKALGRWYAGFGAKPLLVADKPAGHAMVTEDAGGTCEATQPPYINDCDYDAAGALLAHLLGPLKPRAGALGELVAFDQRSYSAPGLADEGLLYAPKTCGTERCRVHVAFHGCRQSAREFADGAGYHRWAEANRVVILYPQVRAGWWPWNPRGCWDWWGYSGLEYATKEGPQIRAVMAMVARLGSPRR